MIRIRSLLLAALLLTSCQAARAALVLTVTASSSVYDVGDVGTVDVLVHSTNAPNDQLDSFLFDLNVTGGSGVTFVTPQPETYLTDPNYVFANRSANVALGLPATAPANAGTTLTAADVSYDLTPATLSEPLPRAIPDSTSPLLLGRFAFNVGGSGNYTISIDPSSSFSNVAFDTFDYTSNTANFTVTVVPEPSSMALVLISGGAVAYRRWRKRACC